MYYIWEHQHLKLWQKQFYIKDIGKSSSIKLRWVIYYTLCIMDPQKKQTHNILLRNNITQNIIRLQNKQYTIYFPLTPDQPPFKGGWCQEPRLGTTLPRAPGSGWRELKQTPWNYTRRAWGARVRRHMQQTHTYGPLPSGIEDLK